LPVAGPGRSFALVPLRFAAAERLQRELEAIFASAEAGPLEGVVRFLPIEHMNGMLVMSTRPDYVDEARRWIERLDQGVETGARRLYVYPVQNGRAADLAALLGELFVTGQEPSGRGALFPPGAATTRLSSTRAGIAHPFEGALPTAAPTGAVDDPVAEIPVIAGAPPPPLPVAGPGRSLRAAEARAAAAGLGQEGLRILADEASNSVVFLATAAEYRTIEEALRQLDIAPLEVLIEATIAEVTLNEQLRYGLQWFFKFGTNSFTFAGNGIPLSQFPGFSYVGTSGADIRVVLNALEAVTDLDVVSSPQLVVLNNQEASLQVGDQVPVVTAQAVNVATDQTLINTIQFIDTGVILRVRPRVNASGLVTLELEQEVSDPVGGGLTPTINQRRIRSTVAVHDGETIALGGLIRDRRSKTRNAVPLLGDIPVLGEAFANTDRSQARTELLVLITPRVMRNMVEARRITDELRNRVRALEALEEKIR
jgi:general secretion pathway protein D